MSPIFLEYSKKKSNVLDFLTIDSTHCAKAAKVVEKKYKG
jgi:hypothetical protein